MRPFLAFYIGLRYHRFGQRRGLVKFISRSSTIGIALGVAVLIIGLSVMNGFERELNQRFLSVVSQGELPAVHPPLRNASRLTQIAQHTQGVVAAAPYISLTGLVSYNGQVDAIAVRGISPKSQLKVTNIKPYVQPQAWQSLIANQPGIILGSQVAAKLKIKQGQSLTLMLAEQSNNGQFKTPKRIRLKVLGTFSVGGQIDGQLAFMNLKLAQQIKKWSAEDVSGIALKVTHPLQANEVVRRVGLQYPQLVYVQSWTRNYGYLYQDIQMVRTIMYAIMLLIVVVACFNIVSTLILAVADKRRDLAILKTLGAQDTLLIHCFMIYGAYNAIMGCFWGIVFGVLGSWWLPDFVDILQRITGHRLLSPDVYFIDFLPSQLHVSNVLVVSATAALIGIVATIWPASRARLIRPADELSH
ncbi:lipoprotein-releasing ABC transporter permease subunit LolE [Celerinatantimonas diazotrophica]|uniref:Lipoprotein-releasing system permease protein n=1 Tax=Celerinatantimonas diazotrophica TaxID=412034 RepID=A0A4R1J8A4_9GAMM|nr:lipoprotein-releasing ABC transporter permease subunit LolE [Celerinatantimonas diazotrophica]TCK46573.1 lipoprotein-releasing system permease protein [Celerinatantimonas diazotrophica]CAG9296623.1 Lipoprotein-releasing system transmembrane protein LolE [Celerinatantimonas diazotrophica]